MRPPAPTALPDGWQMAKIGDVAIVRAGIAFPPRLQGRTTGRYPFFKVSDMNLPSNNLRMRIANNWVDSEALNTLKAEPFPPDTIIFPKVGGAVYTNKKRMLSCAALIDNNVMGVSVINDQCHAEYLFYWLTLIDIRELSNPGPLPSINAGRVKDVFFPLPPLPEQRTIARVLATIQRAVEAQDQLIAATRAFKRALMRHLFTYGAVPPADAARVPLKETEIGAVPVGWEVVRLGEVFLPVNKKQREKRIQDNQIYRLLTVRLYAKGLILRSEQIGARIGTKILYETEAGDFVFSKIDARNGAWGFVTEGLAGSLVSGDFPILKLALSRADQSFMEFLLGRPLVWEPLRNLAVGTTNRRRLQVSQLLSIPILLPPLAEQRAIARILTAVDAKIAAEEKRKAALQTLFKTMLHQLMTGQIRVNAAG